MKMWMKKKRNNLHRKNRGFTLVELIVVLVILAILAAILVPALLGYIDKAKEKSAIIECRQCVIATQSLATERYAVNGKVENNDADKAEILKLAEVNGTITELTMDTTIPSIVHKLVYETKGKMVVTYENGEYTVGAASRTMTGNDVQSIVELLKKNPDTNQKADSGALAENGTVSTAIVNVLNKAGWDLKTLGANSWQYVTRNGGAFFYWSTIDISETASGTKIPVMRYNSVTGTYTVWIATIQKTGQTGTASDPKKYNIFTNYSQYTPSTGQNSDQQTFENMVEKYNQALKENK